MLAYNAAIEGWSRPADDHHDGPGWSAAPRFVLGKVELMQLRIDVGKLAAHRAPLRAVQQAQPRSAGSPLGRGDRALGRWLRP
jgi:hypothetical protein